MASTFSGIEVSKRGLSVHQQGLANIGHNLTNASTPGYSRQQITIETYAPLYVPGLERPQSPGQIGQGASVASINRVRDQLLENVIVTEAQNVGRWQTRRSYLNMVERAYLELSADPASPNQSEGKSARAYLNEFWDAWQDLTLDPESLEKRHIVVQRGKALTASINHRYRSLEHIQTMLNDDVRNLVTEINSAINDIASLNQQITLSRAQGDNPNDLLDRRDLLVRELAGKVDITTSDRDQDEFMIYVGGFTLVQGDKTAGFQIYDNPQNQGFGSVVWEESQEEVRVKGGRLGALLELRDSDLRREIQNLDLAAVNLADLVNEVHKTAYGLDGKTGLDFFTEYPLVNQVNGNYDSDGDGEFDSTYLFRISGGNRLSPNQQIGFAGLITLAGPAGDTVEVAYQPTDTVDQVIRRINLSGAEVSARLDRLGRLSIKGSPAADSAEPDFVIRHLEDSGQFLTGYAGLLNQSGPAGAYDWNQANAVTALAGDESSYAVAPLSHPSGYMAVNPDLEKQPESVAVGMGRPGQGATTGDNRAALAISAFKTDVVNIGRFAKFDDYFAFTTAQIAEKSKTANDRYFTVLAMQKDWEDRQEAYSGVNTNEELSQMIKFQHGYNAAARVLTVFDRMIDTIINRMGV